MDMRQDSTSTVDARLSVLERQNRQIKMVSLFIIVAAGSMMLLAAKKVDPNWIETQRLVLTDANGNARCVLETDEDGSVLQTFMDLKGMQRIKMMVQSDGVARWRLYDDEGNIRVGAGAFPSTFKEAPSRAVLSVLGHGNKVGNLENGGILLSTAKDGSAQQMVFDKSGRLRIEVGSAEADSLSAVSIYGKDDANQCAIRLGTAESGIAFQELFGKEGNQAYQIFTDQTGLVGQYMLDKRGRTRIASIVSPNDSARVVLVDNKEIQRLSLNSFQDGTTSIALADRSGKLRLSSYSGNDGTCGQMQLDPRGNILLSTSTSLEGGVAQSFSAPDGVVRASTSIASNGSLNHYVEKSAAEKAWDVTGDVLQGLELLRLLTEDEK